MLALPGTLRSQRPPSPRSRISGCRADLFRSCVGIGSGPGAQAPVAVARSTGLPGFARCRTRMYKSNCGILLVQAEVRLGGSP